MQSPCRSVQLSLVAEYGWLTLVAGQDDVQLYSLHSNPQTRPPRQWPPMCWYCKQSTWKEWNEQRHAALGQSVDTNPENDSSQTRQIASTAMQQAWWLMTWAKTVYSLPTSQLCHWPQIPYAVQGKLSTPLLQPHSEVSRMYISEPVDV